MKKVLVSIKSLSIGDTVAAIPYINKFQEVNLTDDISVSINDWLIPYFHPVYPNLKLIGKNTNLTFDKIIDLNKIIMLSGMADKQWQKQMEENMLSSLSKNGEIKNKTVKEAITKYKLNDPSAADPGSTAGDS